MSGDPYLPGGEDTDPDLDMNHVYEPTGFPGQLSDAPFNTYYNYFRDYNPSTGRYIESDPIGLAGGLNTYAYANGNPLWYTDPKGLRRRAKDFEDLIDIIEGIGDVRELSRAAEAAFRCRNHFCAMGTLPSKAEIRYWCADNALNVLVRCMDYCSAVILGEGTRQYEADCRNNVACMQ